MSAPRPAFDHEDLDVSAATLEFVALARKVVLQFPRGRASLADQLERASASITLNLAEGYGEFSKKEKVRFYRMSLRSAAECGAIFDVAMRLQAISLNHHHEGKALLARIAAMLTALIRRLGSS